MADSCVPKMSHFVRAERPSSRLGSQVLWLQLANIRPIGAALFLARHKADIFGGASTATISIP
jgi:hypothetical protein